MKKIILLAFTAMMMVGCREVNREKEYIKESEKILVIDYCEYIEREVYYGSVLVHKGNCQFCKERRQKELKELIEQIKEEQQ